MPLATSNFLVPNGTFFVVLIAFIIVVYVITQVRAAARSTRR